MFYRPWAYCPRVIFKLIVMKSDFYLVVLALILSLFVGVCMKFILLDNNAACIITAVSFYGTFNMATYLNSKQKK